MLALVLMVGIVIDDAIVVLENIFRFIEEKKMHPFEAAREATREIGLAVMATTLSLVVIFVPVSFMSSISGRFLFQFGLTAAVAVLVSLLVSFTLTPLMSARLLRRDDHAGAPSSRRGLYGWVDQQYARALGFSMRHRWVVAGLAIIVMLLSYPLYRLVPQEFTPANTDEGEFEINVTAPQGTSFEATRDVMLKIEEELQMIPRLPLILTSAGSARFGGSGYGRVYVRLAPHRERVFSVARLFSLTPWRAFQGNYSQAEVIREVRGRLRKFSDLRIVVAGSRTSINTGGGRNYGIDFSILGPDLESLHQYTDELRKQAPALGLVDADITLKLDTPELRVTIDRERAAALGVDTEDIASALRIMVGGDERASRFRDPAMNDDYDVQLRLAAADRSDPRTIARLYVPGRNGLVRLDNLVTIHEEKTASRIDRVDRQRMAGIRAEIAEGYALADRLDALRNAVREMNLPPTYSTRVGGSGRELERTFNEFLWAFLLSVVFMYMILASQYESVVHPFTILLSLPVSLPFALFSLWVTGNTLNLYSALGLLVLFGVVKKNAILQIDHMNNLRQQGMERLAAIMQANRDRLRPILMTTLTLVAGMLPLAVGTGPGAEERRAVAIVVIGGQSLCLLLTLLVTPVVYSFLDDIGLHVHGRIWGKRRLGRSPALAHATSSPGTSG